MQKWLVKNLCAVRDIGGITADQKGNVYFTTEKEGIWKFNSTDAGAKSELIAKPTSGRFSGIVFDGNNSLYVCNRTENKIYQCVLNNGQLIHIAGTKAGLKDGDAKQAEFTDLGGITVDHNGDLLVAHSFCVRKIHLKDNIVETIAAWNKSYYGSSYQAYFNYHCGITACADHIIYVCDTSCNSILKITDEVVSTVRRSHPFRDCILDNDGSLIVVDGSYLLKVDPITGDLLDDTVPKNIKGWAQCLTKGRRGEIYVGTSVCIIKIEDPWNYERFLWLGRLKEDKSWCNLATLPKEIIKEIAFYLHPRKRKKIMLF